MCHSRLNPKQAINEIVGNFGGGRFFDYTAYGDAINLASRLEVANKQLGTRILVSAALADRVENFHGRPVGDLMLRGRTEAIRAFEPFRLEQCGDPAEGRDQKAFALLESGNARAMAAFAAHRSTCHLKRLLSDAAGTKIILDKYLLNIA